MVAEWLAGGDSSQTGGLCKVKLFFFFKTETEWLPEGGYSQTGSLTEAMLFKTS